MLVRVPIHGLCDSGCGFWNRLDGEAKITGIVASQVFPAFDFYNISEAEDPETGVLKMKTAAVMTTHVDHLLYSCLPDSSTWTNFYWGSLTLDPKNRKPSGIVGSNSPRPPMGSL